VSQVMKVVRNTLITDTDIFTAIDFDFLHRCKVFFFFFFAVLGFELGLYLEPLHQPFFVVFFFFEIGTICQAGFELRSS
jgi:hypothetical protein